MLTTYQEDKEDVPFLDDKSKLPKPKTIFGVLWKTVAIFSSSGMIILFFLFILFLSLFIVFYLESIKTVPSTCALPNYQTRLSHLSTDEYHRTLHLEIRQRIIQNFKDKYGEGDYVLFLEGNKVDKTIVGSPFNNEIQNKNFLYLAGVFWHGYRAAIDMQNSKFILFAREVTGKDRVWSFRNYLSISDIKDKFGADEIYYSNPGNVTSYFINRNPTTLYVENNFESHKMDFNISQTTTINTDILRDFLYEERKVKTDKEIELMQYAIDVSASAHVELMKKVKYSQTEYHMTASFIDETMSCALFDLAYPSICGSGRDSSVLHFESNHNPIDHSKDLFLIDAGGAFYSYSADITRTYSATYNGFFTDKHVTLYSMVLNIQKKALSQLKPGVNFHETINNSTLFEVLVELKKNGFLVGNDLHKMFDLQIHRIFMPHNLGHHLGLNVHDPIDGYHVPYVLKENMVVTVEPGIYFIEYSINSASEQQKKYLNMEKVLSYIDVGGVRIEDDCLITKDGYKILTDKVPKEIEQIQLLTSKL